MEIRNWFFKSNPKLTFAIVLVRKEQPSWTGLDLKD